MLLTAAKVTILEIIIGLYLHLLAISIFWPETLRNHLFCIFSYHLTNFLPHLFCSAFPRPTPLPFGLLTFFITHFLSQVNFQPQAELWVCKSVFSISSLYPSLLTPSWLGAIVPRTWFLLTAKKILGKFGVALTYDLWKLTFCPKCTFYFIIKKGLWS